MGNQFYRRLQINPIIAAIKDEHQLQRAIESPCEIIFVLKSDIFNIRSIVGKIRASGKGVYIHVDLIEGLAKDALALKYIHENINPDGIITTKTSLVRASKNLDIFVIQRFFVLDHLSLNTGIHSIESIKPNAVEILPGIMPKVTKIFTNKTNVPVITGGLIMDKEDVMNSLKSGAIAISTSKEEIWDM
ncbi:MULTISPECIES: glycerol-3-phosphate responsive antiterminator [Clostridium]|uniref:Glycerol-3-phosphate responsive antiterminator n=2 Tax=Clostridium TaxID=1485 RepID=A0A151APG8_9CLOT|nr:MULTISPECIES: glycerol-3-phosphate responsive antiterminator [Clostridium]KYH29515.1 glycerol-3-phosphate responsive antiterminator [Clostridium colicanis DSM 13634]MBE6042749.1 glycerol-3-phosphate responsive antiterminator [Clostridium thermopalmarium]PRR76271.1 Glycerol-3-phosphate responsive antiterminator [Clostridium thermopalmarium DSM 5974]PVZ15825.1 glycerol uptake operon antiterminator [Clostridium thermopalmarium DSM 5974]